LKLTGALRLWPNPRAKSVSSVTSDMLDCRWYVNACCEVDRHEFGSFLVAKLVRAAARTHPLTRFIAEWRYEDLPADVAALAGLCVLDTFAAMVCGAIAPAARIAARHAAATWGPGGATVLATGARQAPAAAAFANATAANGTDLDDVGRYTWGHPGAMVVPTALAVAEDTGASGREFLAGVVLGYEIAFRSGRCLHFGTEGPIVNAAREFRACGAWGATACAAIAAHLRHLSAGEIVHALGIAEYHAPEAPMMRDLELPAMVKHANGVASMTGVQAADLAALGFTGIISRLYAGKYREWTTDIGHNWILPHGIHWKRHSCCSFAHAAIEAIGELRRRHGSVGPQVRAIRVQAYSDAVRLGARVPETSEEAQFSISWPAAVMLEDGEVHPRAMGPERLADPRTRSLAGRVVLTENVDLTARYLLSEAEQPGGEEGAIVDIELIDGTVIGPVKGINILFPERLPGREVVEAKFRWAAADALTQDHIDTVLNLVGSLPELTSVRGLAQSLAVLQRSPS
jgi:2-methylcitrate dehydratase PrpD